MASGTGVKDSVKVRASQCPPPDHWITQYPESWRRIRKSFTRGEAALPALRFGPAGHLGWFGISAIADEVIMITLTTGVALLPALSWAV